MKSIETDLRKWLDVLSRAKFNTHPLVFEPPATETEVLALEAELGQEIPLCFRRVLTEISGHVEFRWFAPRGYEFPEPFHQNFSGDLHWSLSFVSQFNQAKQQWLEAVFNNPNDPYDRIWHNKLAFYEIGNGDYLAIDLAEASRGQVVYLSHDDGAGHGYVLAESFPDLLDRWIPIACAGGEDWQWLPFTNTMSTFVDPTGSAAKQWKELLLQLSEA